MKLVVVATGPVVTVGGGGRAGVMARRNADATVERCKPGRTWPSKEHPRAMCRGRERAMLGLGPLADVVDLSCWAFGEPAAKD